MMNQENFYVVGIGASAGGLDAVQQLFDNLPDNPGMAFIIVQHLSPDFKSLMPELLSKHTNMEIFTAEEGLEIQPNCIYLNQRSKNLVLNGNKLNLPEKSPKETLNHPIDIFFNSLGKFYRDKSIGVILSGTGSDGSRGIKAIKEEGGTILVQDPDSAQFNGMPNAAILTHLADFVLQPYGIAKKLIHYTKTKPDIGTESIEDGTTGQFFQKILTEIQKFSGVNFKKYKYNTLLRRIEKRMSLQNIQSLENYYKLIA
ncbi:MAG TPA: chemotaxis protein CheB, partial [Mariniphaga sp.]|nr:chemotaxis protein CheB [Mariniphaga sp.]